MNFTARQIAEMIHGTIIGNPDVSFSGFSKIVDTQPRTISFIGAPQYVKYLSETKAEAIIITKKLVPDCQCNTTLIVVEDAHQAFVELIRMYDKLTKNDLAGISSNAFIENTAKIGNDCYIGDTTVIMKNAVIGDNCKIYPQVFLGTNVTIGPGTTLMPGTKIYDNCHVGSNCLIHAGVVIGSDGFGFTQENGINVKVPQLGNVIIGNDVEIGANTTIDRAKMNETVIGANTKIDNLVQIGHNVKIGMSSILVSQVGVAGSAEIGTVLLLPAKQVSQAV